MKANIKELWVFESFYFTVQEVIRPVFFICACFSCLID